MPYEIPSGALSKSKPLVILFTPRNVLITLLGVGGNIVKDTPYSFRVYKFVKRVYNSSIDIKTPFIPSGGFTNEMLMFTMTLQNQDTGSAAIVHVFLNNYTVANQGSAISLIGDSSWSVTKYDSDERTHLSITYNGNTGWLSAEILCAYLGGSNAQNLQTMYSENFV